MLGQLGLSNTEKEKKYERQKETLLPERSPGQGRQHHEPRHQGLCCPAARCCGCEAADAITRCHHRRRVVVGVGVGGGVGRGDNQLCAVSLSLLPGAS